MLGPLWKCNLRLRRRCREGGSCSIIRPNSVGSQGFLPDRQRVLVGRLGLDVLAPGVVERREVVDPPLQLLSLIRALS